METGNELAMTDLEARMGALERRIARQEAHTAIQNIFGHYETIHTPMSMYRTPEVFALTMTDVSMEVSDWGRWVGADAVTYLFGTVMKEELIGTMFVHTLATPIIEVAGDCQTARGIWASPGYETQISASGPQGFWCWGSYSADFILESGKWKVWHLKWWRTFRCDYHKCWTDDWQSVMTGTPKKHEYRPEPCTFFHPYDPKTQRWPFPYTPQPYETWDGDNKMDWAFGPYKEEYFATHTPTSEFEFAHGKPCGVISNNFSAESRPAAD